MQNTYSATIAALTGVVTGLQKHPLVGALAINGTTFTSAELVTAIQSVIESLNATVAARAAYLEATQSCEQMLADNRVLLRDTKHLIQIAYGQQSGALSDFGLAPRREKTMTPAAHVAAAEKAKATRVARGTTSKKQKALIHGAVTGVTITPIVVHVPAAASGGDAT